MPRHMASEVERYDDLVLSTPGIRLYLPMDETNGTKIADRAKNDHGTFAGTGMLGRTGPGGARSIYFNGTDTNISWPGTNIGDFGDGPFTYELWFQVTGGAGTNRKLILAGPGSLEVSPRSDDKIHGGKDATGYFADGTATVIANGRWHLATIVKNASTLRKVYLDGKDDTASVAAVTVTHSVTTGYIGSTNVSGEWFPGYICRVAAYRAALSLNDHRVRWVTGQGG